MVLDLKEPRSIADWLGIAPSRHRQQLRAMWMLWPQFRECIEAGVKLADWALEAQTDSGGGGGA